MASIGSINDLTSLGSGVYQMNFSGTPNRGFVTSDNNVLAPLWYCKMKMKFDTNWNWGSTVYDGGDPFLSNCKIFRMWNPGSTKENFEVELDGWTNEGKWVFEDNQGNAADVGYILQGYKSTLKPGAEAVFEYEFKDSDPNMANGYFKMWLNGVAIENVQGIKTRTDGGLKRIYILGLENEWNVGPKHGNNTLTFSDIVLAENKTRDQYNGSAPIPTPTPTPTPTPVPTPVYALKSDLDVVNADLQALKQKLRSV